MYLSIHNQPIYMYTVGKKFNEQLPSVLFIHGVACDHSVWILQSRYLAYHGYNVFAIDLPGHGNSKGATPQSVESAARTVVDLVNQLNLPKLTLVGHSWGSLIALEASAHLGTKVSHLVLIGTAYPMQVGETLLDAAKNNPDQGLQMIHRFSRSTLGSSPSVLGPGTWVYGANLALGRMIVAKNTVDNVLYSGLKACHDYQGGLEALARLTCPTSFILGQGDKMTPPKSAQKMIDLAQQTQLLGRVYTVPCGHFQMSECGTETLQCLQEILKL
ncbi:MAG: alpha/beta hydrolase [Gammaproteobacteria bacterium]|nr:alpha/beta hydrolase [Gammaproteobacteria bacterium]